MKSNNLLLKSIELLGICVLILVVLALVSTPYFFTSQTLSMTIATSIMAIAISILSLTSLIRLVGYTHYRWLVVLGSILIIIGGIVFLFLPEFFWKAVSIPFPFWYRVTFYTLPAICVEGGILTLFTVFMEQGTAHRTSREKILLSILFFLYATTMVTTNFLVIGGFVPVQGHIIFSRIVLGTVIIISTYMITNHNKPSHVLR